MSSTVRFVKRFYDVSLKEIILTVVFIFALAASIGLGIANRQPIFATPNDNNNSQNENNGNNGNNEDDQVAAEQPNEENEGNPNEEEEVPAGNPFPTEEENTTPPPAPTPPAPTPTPTPTPPAVQSATTIPNAGPGETALALFLGVSVLGYLVSTYIQRHKAIAWLD